MKIFFDFLQHSHDYYLDCVEYSILFTFKIFSAMFSTNVLIDDRRDVIRCLAWPAKIP
jgi:hypothetical protein